MVQLYAFPPVVRRAGAVFWRLSPASVTPASARSHHGAGRHGPCTACRPSCQTGNHGYRHYRHIARGVALEARGEKCQARGFASGDASIGVGRCFYRHFGRGSGSSNVVAEAQRYIGGNPTGRREACGARASMNMVLQHSGLSRHRLGPGAFSSRATASACPDRRSAPIAVMGRRGGGGHVGVVSGIDAGGNPIVVSGNNGNRVREAPISRGRIYALCDADELIR